MAEPVLRPLSLGEILDRTFSLYRRHFLLFVGITAIPHLLILVLNLWQTVVMKAPMVTTKGPLGVQVHRPTGASGVMSLGLAWGLVAIVVYLSAYLFSQGGTIYAVSELYLGRSTTVGESLRRVWGQLGGLFGVVMLNGLAVMGACIFLIIPGIYVACRLITCVPAALLDRVFLSDGGDRVIGVRAFEPDERAADKLRPAFKTRSRGQQFRRFGDDVGAGDG